MTGQINLSVPSYRAARAIARPLALAGDRAGATRRMCELLWLVPGDQGGFYGLSDRQLEELCARDPHLDLNVASETLWSHPGVWPVVSGEKVAGKIV